MICCVRESAIRWNGKQFAQQLRIIKLRIKWIGNVARRAYIHQARTPSRPATAAAAAAAATPRVAGSARRSLSRIPLVRQRRQMKQPERRKALTSLAI